MTAARRPIASEGELLPEARLRYIQDLFKSDLALCENLEREGHFARLEAAGKINLSDHLRGRLAAAIACYEEMGCKKKRKSRARQLRAAAHLCERTAKSLETIFGHAVGEGPFPWSTPVSRIVDLRATATSIAPAKGKPGNAYRLHDATLIFSLAHIYFDAGGRIGQSANGPWVRLLTTVWEALPAGVRPKNNTALPRRAEEMQQGLALAFPWTGRDDSRARRDAPKEFGHSDFLGLIHHLSTER